MMMMMMMPTSLVDILIVYICLVYYLKNNKHTIAKVRENANRHGGKNATITK